MESKTYEIIQNEIILKNIRGHQYGYNNICYNYDQGGCGPKNVVPRFLNYSNPESWEPIKDIKNLRKSYSLVMAKHDRNRSSSEIHNKSTEIAEDYFKYDMSEFKFINETPVVIENRSIWESLCDKHAIQDPYFKNYNILYFDFWFYELNVVLELDGIRYHNPIHDLIRDQYCKIMYPWLRILRYSYNTITTKKEQNSFKKFIENSGLFKIENLSSDHIWEFDYLDKITNSFIGYHKKTIDVIDIILREFDMNSLSEINFEHFSKLGLDSLWSDFSRFFTDWVLEKPISNKIDLFELMSSKKKR